MERLVEVWMPEQMVRRLEAGIACSQVALHPEGDGTYSVRLRVAPSEARCWNWPVSTVEGDGEALVRERAA